MSSAELIGGLVCGAVGAGCCLYGRRQRLTMPLLCGAGLILLPYFIDNSVLLVAVGVALIAAPFVLRP